VAADELFECGRVAALDEGTQQLRLSRLIRGRGGVAQVPNGVADANVHVALRRGLHPSPIIGRPAVGAPIVFDNLTVQDVRGNGNW